MSQTRSVFTVEAANNGRVLHYRNAVTVLLNAVAADVEWTSLNELFRVSYLHLHYAVLFGNMYPRRVQNFSPLRVFLNIQWYFSPKLYLLIAKRRGER
jgi:hypothetical protein